MTAVAMSWSRSRWVQMEPPSWSRWRAARRSSPAAESAMAVKTSAMRVSWRSGRRRWEIEPSMPARGIVNRSGSMVNCGSPARLAALWTIERGRPTMRAMSTQAPRPAEAKISKTVRIAIAAARFNAEIVDELLSGCLRRLGELGVGEDRIGTVRGPGAFELPVTAAAFARAGRHGAVICLGAVVRGETPHFDYVAGEAARGIQDVAVQTGVPMIFGVLTTNTQEQAVD